MTELTDRGAIVPLVATSSLQVMVSLTMFGVAVIAPVAAPDIGVEATLIGTFTAIAYGAGISAAFLTGALFLSLWRDPRRADYDGAGISGCRLSCPVESGHGTSECCLARN